ncbi:MAG TPA: hypothetical protein VML55_06480 [Planctomycetaceae bacterium]|nr:hypothetical protein [Planctomycetaceae bacterium]
MATARRISAQETRAHMESDQHDTLLVCAYDSPAKSEENHLEGAISLQEFESQVDELDRDREIVFYCA